jgi:hypothetical protein
MSFIVQAPGETQTYSQILDKAVNHDQWENTLAYCTLV